MRVRVYKKNKSITRRSEKEGGGLRGAEKEKLGGVF